MAKRLRRQKSYFIEKYNSSESFRLFTIFLILSVSIYTINYVTTPNDDFSFYSSHIFVKDTEKETFQKLITLNPAIWQDMDFIRITDQKTQREVIKQASSENQSQAIGRYYDGGIEVYIESQNYPGITMHEVGHHEFKKLTLEERHDWNHKSNETRFDYWGKQNLHYTTSSNEDFAESFALFVEITDIGGEYIREDKYEEIVNNWRYEWIRQYICDNYKCILFIDNNWFTGPLILESATGVEM